MVEIYIFISITSLVVLAVLLVRLWALRRATGAIELLLFTISSSIWVAGYAFEIILPRLEDKLFWARCEYIGIATVSVWVLVFIVRYSGFKPWLSVWQVLGLLVVPALTILFVFSNDAHHWVWTGIALQPGWGSAPLALEHGWWFWVNISYSYLLLVIGSVLMGQFIVRAQQLYLTQAMLMLGGMAGPWIGNALYILGVRPGPNLDLTPVAFTLTNIGLVVGFLFYRLLDIRPVAYSSIFRAMSDGVVVLDPLYRIVDINPAAHAIFDRSYFETQDLPPLLEPGFVDSFIGHAMEEVLPNWQAAVEDTREISLSVGPEAEQRYYLLKSTSILDKSQKITGHVLIFSDITRIKLTEAELTLAHDHALESNRLKNQLLDNVSHDMRTPLSAIVGYTDMLSSGLFGELQPEVRSTVLEIQDSANQLYMFINNLIGQAQYEAKRIKIQLRELSIPELIGAVRIWFELTASKKRLEMVYEVDPALPKTLRGDPYWLRQVVLNLVSNALKFTDQGKITVRVTCAGPDDWAIEVADSGIGIPFDAQGQIFESFRRGDSAVALERTGSGLGLAVVKELVQLMGGQVSLNSQMGVGSTFRVRLPLQTGEPAA